MGLGLSIIQSAITCVRWHHQMEWRSLSTRNLSDWQCFHQPAVLGKMQSIWEATHSQQVLFIQAFHYHCSCQSHRNQVKLRQCHRFGWVKHRPETHSMNQSTIQKALLFLCCLLWWIEAWQIAPLRLVATLGPLSICQSVNLTLGEAQSRNQS